MERETLNRVKDVRRGMFILGLIFILFSLTFAGGLFYKGYMEFLYRIANLFAFISGIIYIGSAIYIFKRKEKVRKLSVYTSTILLLYFVYAIFHLVKFNTCYPTDADCYLKSVTSPILTFSTLVFFTLLLIIYLTRPKVKEQFK